YQSCCGKIICYGCACADALARQSSQGNCPFCRAPLESSRDERIERFRKRVEARDTNAMYSLGHKYFFGVPQDFQKALELWNQAAKLGCAKSHHNIGGVYFAGEGVEKDMKKAKYHMERAAMGGDAIARHILGVEEGKAFNMNRAMKHFMISAVFGDDDSLKEIQDGFSDGHVTKDDF
ncbi:hypothetical protein ACHAXR_000068, partial [Thalassiosira sp. AJA248-18]